MTHGRHRLTLGAAGARALRLGAVLVAVLWATSVAAHLPEGAVLDIPHIDDAQLPVVDAGLEDWATRTPLLGNADFVDLVAAAPAQPADLDVRVWLGWNETANRLYVAARVSDDVHQVDRPAGTAASRIFQDDDLEIFVDADHSGGQYADLSTLSPEEQLAENGTEANHFVIAGPHPDGDFFVNFSAAGWYAMEDGDYTKAAVAYDGAVAGPGESRYEVSLVPFDRINVVADFLSAPHDLQAGEILGLNLEFSDFDALAEQYDAKWSLSGGYNAFRLSERFTDVRLLPPASGTTVVEDVSWGRIKASFHSQ